MSKLEFIVLTVVSIVIGDLLVRMVIWSLKRIEIPYDAMIKSVFSWYVILPSIFSILIASVVLEALYLQAASVLLLVLTAYFRPISQPPKESAEQPNRTERSNTTSLTIGDFVRAFGEVQKAVKDDESVSLLYMTIAAFVIARKRNRDEDTGI